MDKKKNVCLTRRKFFCVVTILDNVVESNSGRVHDDTAADDKLTTMPKRW